MHDQASRGQIIVMTESEARSRYPGLVVASLGAQRKQKPGGKVTARVLFDGTHGLCVNSKTRLRDQERAPIAADLKRSMREKSRIGELTFALSADVTEAHRQVPIHPDDWHLLGCQVSPWWRRSRYCIGVLLLVPGRSSCRSSCPISLRVYLHVLAYARRRRLFIGVRRHRISHWSAFILRIVCRCWRASILAQNLWR